MRNPFKKKHLPNRRVLVGGEGTRDQIPVADANSYVHVQWNFNKEKRRHLHIDNDKNLDGYGITWTHNL